MRDALKSRDWQQVILALVMAQPQSTVSAILTGHRKLTARLAIDYGEVLGLAPEDLLREQDARLLANLPNREAILAGVRLRGEMMTAQLAGDIEAEIESLRKQRKVIDDQIVRLMGIQERQRRVEANQ